MLVNVPKGMPDLDRAKLIKFAKQNKIIDKYDGVYGKNGFFSAHDCAQGDFKRLASKCTGMSEIELYNAIMDIE